jgi:plasmid maintenance system antidote protein VapI
MAPVPRLSRAGDSCARCDEFGRTCPSCTQRRHVAWRLVDQQGNTIEETAATLNLQPVRIRQLVEHERNRQELEKYRLDSIPVTRAREFLEHELARDPVLTRAEVAHRMGIRQADFDRAFGYAPTKHGAMQTRVGIVTASRLVRALGRAPYELDGC